MLYCRYLLIDLKKIHDRIKEFQKMKHMPPSTIMSVKRFESNRSLKLMSQKSVGKKANFGNKKIKLLVCQCFTSKQWEKHSKIYDHFEALRKTFQMRPCWMSLLYPFRNGVRMKTGSQECGISLHDFHGLSLFKHKNQTHWVKKIFLVPFLRKFEAL